MISNRKQFIDEIMKHLPGRDRNFVRRWLAESGVPRFGHPDWDWSEGAARDLAHEFLHEDD